MRYIRSFIAVNLPIAMVKKLQALQGEVRARAEHAGLKVGWVPAANMHVTLKFLAEIPEESLWAIRDTLQAKLQIATPFLATIREVGAFPDRQRPRVLWVGLACENDRLASLAKEMDDWLFDLGFARETRPFHPHVTLGRVKSGQADVLEGLAERELGSCPIREIVLYQSILKPKGAQYSELARIPLLSGKPASPQAPSIDEKSLDQKADLNDMNEPEEL
jgi:RNA 2',3'-cyclic 3'-phosphodiesterase